MKPRKIISDDKKKIINGFNTAADIVGSTYGPGGGNVIIERAHQNALVTNDGVSVAKHLYMDDEIEDLGASLVRDMTFEADQGSGDGTTTTAVIARGLLNQYYKENETNQNLEANELLKLTDLACKELDKNARKITTKEEYIDVATVSVESEEYGKIIGEMFHESGEYGYVYVEYDYGFDVKTRKIDGFQLDCGLLSIDYSINGAYTTELGISNVIITDKEVDINAVTNLSKSIKSAKLSGVDFNSIVLIAPGYTDEAKSTLGYLFFNSTINTKLNKEQKESALPPVIPIIAPVTHQEILMRDLSALSGSEIISDLKDLELDNFGKPFKKILLKKNKTYFIGAPNDVLEYVADLEKQKEDMTKADKERMDKRIARITGSVSVIQVGGETDAERLYRYHKIKDAVNATRLAISEGVIHGGGYGLMDVKSLDLSYAHEVIRENIGAPFDRSDKIIDSVAVVKNSLKKAASAVAQLLRTRYGVSNKRLSVEEEYKIEMSS